MPNQEPPTPPQLSTAKPPLNKLFKWSLIITAAVALYAVLGFAALPWAARSLGPDKLSQTLQRNVSIQEIRFNPFSLVLEMKGLQVLEPDGSTVFVSLQRLRANVRLLSLLRLAVGLDELLLEEPYVHISQDKTGQYNFSDLIAGDGGDPSEPTGSGMALFPAIVYDFSIRGGALVFDDQVHAKQHKVEDLELSIPFTSTLPDDSKQYVSPSLRAMVNGRSLVLEGRSRPFEDTLRTEFNFNLDRLDLTQYWAYVPLPRQAVLQSGTLSCDLSLVFLQQDSAQPHISLMGQVQAHDFNLRLDGQPLASFKELAVTVNGLSLDQQLLDLGLVRLSGAKASVVLDEQGGLNWSGLIPAPPGQQETSLAASPADTGEQAKQVGFTVTTQRLELLDGNIQFQDKARGFSMAIDPLTLEVNELNSSGGDAKFKLSAGLGGPQQITALGTFNPADISSTGTLDLSGIDVTTLAPYFAEALPAELLSCTASASLPYSLQTGAEPVLTLDKASAELTDIAVRRKDGKGATLRVNSLRLADAVINAQAASGHLREVALDGASLNEASAAAKAHPFGTLKGITLTDVSFAADPAKADIGQVLLKELSVSAPGDPDPALTLARLEVSPLAFDGDQKTLGIKRVLALNPKLATVLNAQGLSNLARIASAATGDPLPVVNSSSEASKTQAPQSQVPDTQTDQTSSEQAGEAAASSAISSPPPTQPGMRFSLATLEIREGSVSFRDESISPPYATSLENLSGRLEKVSTVPGEPQATLALTGTVDRHAPLIVEGAASPTDLGINPRVHLTLTNMDLTALSPYTAKFMSYSLATGQLSLDINTVIEGTQVTGENKFMLNNINLGNYQKSPDDMGIPLSLALALLADRSGNVQLDVPVRGDLNDPSFQLGNVLFKAVLNVLFKAVTSPFALLGGLFGGGEDLGALAMPPGLAALGPNAPDKLDSMAKALGARPRLKLQLAGTTSPVADRQALTELRLQRAIKTPRFLELQGEDKAPASVDEVVLSGEEYPDYLEEAYAAAPFEKEKNAFGLLKGQPVEVMEQLLREHLAATDQEILEIGRQRAALVRDALLERGVDPGRIFLREATPKDAEKMPMGVVLTLQ